MSTDTAALVRQMREALAARRAFDVEPGCAINRKLYGDMDRAIAAADKWLAQQRGPLIARLRSEWHDDDGSVCWWAWCGKTWAGEPPWIGTPLDSDWPGYHTHWTPRPPAPERAADISQPAGGDAP